MLEQHLHRDEALRPGSKSLGLFKGEFPFFRRSDVVNVRSAENWYRTGRVVKPNEIPMKFVKQRAVTIHRRREEELAKMDGGEVDEQPLYAEEQTETYVPPPVVDVSRLLSLLQLSRYGALTLEFEGTGQSAEEQLWQH